MRRTIPLLALWAVSALVGCDDDGDGALRECIDPGPECTGLCPLYDERLNTVRGQWQDGRIDGYIAHLCGEYHVVTRYSDEGQTDNYFDANGLLVSTALRGARTREFGKDCLNAVRWQGPKIECAPRCGLAFSRPPETLLGIPACEERCNAAEPVCSGVCPTVDQRAAEVAAQWDRGDLDAWFHYTCGDYEVVSRYDDERRTDNYFGPDGELVSSALVGDHLDFGLGCPDLTAWQGPMVDCTPGCTLAESRAPQAELGISPCRCQTPEPVCSGVCPTFDERARTVQRQQSAGEIDAYATWRCEGYLVVSRFDDEGRTDNYYRDRDHLEATARIGNTQNYGRFCVDDTAWQGPPVSCTPTCALTASRNPEPLIGVAACPADPDMGVPDMGVGDQGVADLGVVDQGVPDAAPADAGIPDAGACVAEGDSVAVVPNAPACCPGLTPVGCGAPGADGQCEECVGASICARCGDGVCGAGENACNCAEDCAHAPGQCQGTADCQGHPAPIRCVGAWRCDPAGLRMADDQGADGCGYTCIFNLATCAADQPCPEGDRCVSCPFPGQCDGPTVCVAGDDPTCRVPADCDGLPHDACAGAWDCAANRCVWQCL
ncbi:MAG: hypothetical protein R3F60_32485 [bacterium]